jgi:hypothetical protein
MMDKQKAHKGRGNCTLWGIKFWDEKVNKNNKKESLKN